VDKERKFEWIDGVVRVSEFRPTTEYRHMPSGALEYRYMSEHGWSQWQQCSSLYPEVIRLLAEGSHGS
jgi:hypothetical protein